LLVGCGTSVNTSNNSAETKDELITTSETEDTTENSESAVEASTDKHKCQVSMANYIPSSESAPSNLYSIYSYSTFNGESSISMINSEGDIISASLDNLLMEALQQCPVTLYIEPIVDEAYPDDTGDDIDNETITSLADLDTKSFVFYIGFYALSDEDAYNEFLNVSENFEAETGISLDTDEEDLSDEELNTIKSYLLEGLSQEYLDGALDFYNEYSNELTESSTDTKELISYVLYDAQYNKLGELTVDEIVDYANEALAEIQDKVNNTDRVSEDVYELWLSSVEQDTYYTIEDQLTLVNDTGSILRICTVSYNDIFDTYEFEAEYIFPEVWGTSDRGDTGTTPCTVIGSSGTYYYSDEEDEPTVSPNLCLFWIDEATLDEATAEARNTSITAITDNGSEILDSEILNVSDINTINSITGFQFIYNDTDSSVTLASDYVDSITIESGDTIAIEWTALGNISIVE
jgi:hypothetical protein